MQTSCKIPLSTILTNSRYAIKVTTIEQAKALIPDYFAMEDLEHFFSYVPGHREFVSSAVHPVRGPELVFCHPEGKQVVEFDDVELTI